MNEKKLQILKAKQDKKKRLEKARATKRDQLDEQHKQSLEAGKASSDAILSSLEGLRELIGEQDYDGLIKELSKLDTLKEGLEAINKSIREQKFVFPDKTTVTNLADLAKYIKQPDIKFPEVIDKKWQKEISDKLKALEKGVQIKIVNRDAGDFIPFRRVWKVGNRLMFDDSQWTGSSGGGSSGGGSSEVTQGTDPWVVSASSLPLPSGAATSAKQDTQQTALDAIKTAAEILDNIVSGSEAQVDIVGALPAGDNTVGRAKLTDGTDVAEINARTDGKVALEVADDMTSFEAFTQALVASTDTTITFSQTVRLIRVKNNSTTAVVYVRDGAISSDTPANAELVGLAAAANLPNTEYYPFVGTTIHLRSAGTPTVSVTGFY